MLKDSQPIFLSPKSGDLSIKTGFEFDQVINFVDESIGGFLSYYQANDESEKENWISNILVRHFQICNKENGGYFPYDFSKNPPQAASGKETDIGVYVTTRTAKPIPILEFESKRFSHSSNNKEYVSGDRGGIERFKRGYHSSHLTVCGMFAFIQKPTTDGWIKKVNKWIGELAKTNTDNTIDWTNIDELLIQTKTFSKVEKLSSKHIRKQSNDSIFLWHYFIDLN